MNLKLVHFLDKVQFYSCCLIAALLIILPFKYINILTGVLFLTSLLKYADNFHRERAGFNRVALAYSIPHLLLFFLFAFEILTSYSFPEAIKLIEKRVVFLVFPLILLLDPFFIKDRIKTVIDSFVAGVFAVLAICYTYAFYRFFFVPFSLKESSNWDNVNRGSGEGKFAALDPFFYKEFVELFAITPVYLSMYVCFCISAIFWFYFHRESGFSKIEWKRIALLTVLILALLQLSVRGVILPFLLLFFAYVIYFLFKRFSKVWSIVIAIGIISAGSLMIMNVPIFKERLFTQLKHAFSAPKSPVSNSLQIRIIQYQCAIDIFLDAPWLGNGEKAERLLWDCAADKIPKKYRQQLNAHNQYLEFLTQIGIIGTIIFFSAMFTPYFRLPKNRQLYTILLVCVLIAYIGESIMARYYGFMFFFFFNTLILSALLYKHNDVKLT